MMEGRDGSMSDTRELVVLAHGMIRTPASMWVLARSLRARGYRVLNWGYSSYTRPLAELGAMLARDVAAAAGGAAKVHFVGHSLGTVHANVPPGLSTRTSSAIASTSAWMCSSTSEVMTRSNDPDANGNRVASPRSTPTKRSSRISFSSIIAPNVLRVITTSSIA